MAATLLRQPGAGWDTRHRAMHSKFCGESRAGGPGAKANMGIAYRGRKILSRLMAPGKHKFTWEGKSSFGSSGAQTRHSSNRPARCPNERRVFHLGWLLAPGCGRRNPFIGFELVAFSGGMAAKRQPMGRGGEVLLASRYPRRSRKPSISCRTSPGWVRNT
jgi:hypothetical protein